MAGNVLDQASILQATELFSERQASSDKEEKHEYPPGSGGKHQGSTGKAM